MEAMRMTSTMAESMRNSQPMPINTTETSSRRSPTRSMTIPSRRRPGATGGDAYDTEADAISHRIRGLAMHDIQRIIETGIYVDDLDKAEAFYHDVLGLPVLAREKGRHVFFQVGDASVLLV